MLAEEPVEARAGLGGIAEPVGGLRREIAAEDPVRRKVLQDRGRDAGCGCHEDERPLEKRRLAADDAKIDLLALVGLVDRRLELDMNVVGFRCSPCLRRTKQPRSGVQDSGSRLGKIAIGDAMVRPLGLVGAVIRRGRRDTGKGRLYGAAIRLVDRCVAGATHIAARPAPASDAKEQAQCDTTYRRVESNFLSSRHRRQPWQPPCGCGACRRC